MIIAVTGTPGTGKSVLAKKICQATGINYFGVSNHLDEVSDGMDEERGIPLVDVEKLQERVDKIRGDLVIDGHMTHELNSKQVDICFVTRCDVTVLSKRLTKRKYDDAKIRENLDAEITEVILDEAYGNNQNVIVIDTTEGVDLDYVLDEIKKFKERT